MLTPRIKEVKVLEDYKLLLIYENEEHRVYDMKPNLKYEAFEKLKEDLDRSPQRKNTTDSPSLEKGKEKVTTFVFR